MPIQLIYAFSHVELKDSFIVSDKNNLSQKLSLIVKVKLIITYSLRDNVY
jgi:hypothetical protein